MAGELTAQFELELLDRMSGPLREVLDRIEALNRVLSQFNGQNEETSNATETLNKALRDATGGADAASEAVERAGAAMGGMGRAGTEAAEGLNPLNEKLSAVEENATRSIGVMGRLKSAMGGLKDDVGHAMHGFHEKWGRAQGQGFGALVSGFELVEPVKEAAEYDNTIRHVGIGLEIHGAELDQYVAAEKVRINELARATGQRSGDLAEALGFFSREGFRGEELESSLATTAKIATAYNAHPEAVAKSAFTLKESLGIDDAHLQGALASVAIAGKNADLPFEKLAPLLPQAAASAGSLGLKGRAAVDDLAAAMAVVRKTTGTEGEAVTNTRAFLKTVTSTAGAKRWHEVFHEDIFDLEAKARQHGQDPMLAILSRVRQLVNKVGDTNKGVAKLFNNVEDTGFVKALLENWPQYVAIHQKVAGATQGVIDQDYADGRKSELIEVQQFEDAMAQLMRRIGDDFAPILARITAVVNSVNAGLEKMDHALPGVSTYLIGAVGAFLGLTAVLAAVGAVSTAVSAGFGVLAAVMGVLSWPVVLTVAGIIAVGVALYECWKHWDKIKLVLSQVGQAVVDFINRMLNAIPSALKGAWGSVTGAVSRVFHPGATPAPQAGPPNNALMVSGHAGPVPANDNPVQRAMTPLPTQQGGLAGAVGLPGLHDALGQLRRPAMPSQQGGLAGAVGMPGLHDALGQLRLPAAVQPGPAAGLPGLHDALGQLRRPAAVQTKPAAAQPVLSPVVQRREEPPPPSRVHLYVHAAEGMQVRAESQNNQPLDVHVHGGLNSMMGRP
ncbi:phage tail tape measure protein [Bombella apis]|uniref:phage tail tape measure protein n=1 Tax=Bombella apis TaxID=1785988 RepID=UPI0012B8E5CC|nr:phage tail tape measure protein [Bombella apis]MPW00073.1 phage tail tape measure protein [Bombella apis]